MAFRSLFVAAAAGVLGMSSLASAALIGVNFEGRNDANNGLNPTDVAGKDPQANWNNAPNTTTNGTNTTYTGLVDSSGAATSITLSAVAGDSWSSGSGHLTPDNTLLNGILKAGTSGDGLTTMTLTWNNLTPGANYNVVLETAENGGGGTANISVNGGTPVNYTDVDGGTQQGPVTYVTFPNSPTPSNYAEFDGVAANSNGQIVISVAWAGGSDGFGVGGAQLVTPVPEPASVALLSLGGLGFLARRRRA